MAKSSVRTHPWIRGMDRHFLTGFITVANGAATAGPGYGFTVTDVNTGVYTVTFAEPLREIIGIHVTVAESTLKLMAQVTAQSTTEFTVKLYDEGGTARDCDIGVAFSVEHRETSAEPR